MAQPQFAPSSTQIIAQNPYYQPQQTQYAATSSSSSAQPTTPMRLDTGRVAIQPGQTWFNIPGAIYFYHLGQPYYEFTNFFPLNPPITLDGHQWPTTEHYFQAQKAPYNSPTYLNIKGASTPRGAFNLVKGMQLPQNWHQQVKFDAMLKALRAKFTQNQQLKNQLINTGNTILVENAGANDAEWGAGANGDGKNHLGRMLMHVRYELQTGQQYAYIP